ncbi:hypothetical protein C0989_007886 [Termitomyces sp. Mn162]|nr:hypothetical protein C0989_007886 [Termitomyces sp. Mn162]
MRNMVPMFNDIAKKVRQIVACQYLRQQTSNMLDQIEIAIKKSLAQGTREAGKFLMNPDFVSL